MKKIVCAMILVLGWVINAPAAVVYLQDGGTIKAQKIWRKKGKIVVLVHHDSITSFALSEINLKKTFPPRKKRVKRITAATPATTTPAAVPDGASQSTTAPAAVVQTAKGGKRLSLPSISTKLPEREIPKGSEEGTLRKQKREMEEQMKD